MQDFKGIQVLVKVNAKCNSNVLHGFQTIIPRFILIYTTISNIDTVTLLCAIK